MAASCLMPIAVSTVVLSLMAPCRVVCVVAYILVPQTTSFVLPSIHAACVALLTASSVMLLVVCPVVLLTKASCVMLPVLVSWHVVLLKAPSVLLVKNLFCC